MLDAIDVVIQIAVLAVDAVLDFRKDHLTVRTEGIGAFRHQAIGREYIVLTILGSNQRAADVVVIFSYLNQTDGSGSIVDKIYIIIVNELQSIALDHLTVAVKDIETVFLAVTAGFNSLETSCHVAVIVEIVGVAFDVEEGSVYFAAGPVIDLMAVLLAPGALNQNTVLIKGVLNLINHLHAGIGGVILTEVVIVFANLLPAAGKYASRDIAGYVCFSINVQACILGLTDIYAVLAEVVVIQLTIRIQCLLNAMQSLAGNVVGKAAVLVDPTFLQEILQGEFIVNGSVSISEVAAGVGAHRRIAVRIQSEDCLVIRLLCEGVQTASAHVDLITNAALTYCLDDGFFARKCAFLGRKLNTVNQTQRVCRGRIDGLRNADPVQSQG